MNTTFTDYANFGIPSPLRYTWVFYGTFIILSSFIGDTLILVASIKYNAIKLHKSIVTIMQHLAVCDLITSANLTLFVITLSAERNIIGSFLCYIRAYLSFICFPISFYLTAALTTTKAALLKFPLHESRWTRRRSHQLCGAIWIGSLSTPLLMLILDRNDVKFNFKEYACHYAFSSYVWKILRPVMGTIISLLPNILVVVTTTWLMLEARRVARRGQDNLRWQGLVTVILTAVVYCVSVLPMTLYHLVGDLVTWDPQGFFHVYFYRFSLAVICVNVVSNFYIYSLTVRSFREFFMSRVRLLRDN